MGDNVPHIDNDIGLQANELAAVIAYARRHGVLPLVEVGLFGLLANAYQARPRSSASSASSRASSFLLNRQS